jgi:o-succinylbenzoate---CoA ligase
MVVEGWLTRAAAAHPRRTALQTPTGSWSYAELLAAARSGADELAQRGAGPGQRVAITLPAGLAFAQALHACLLLGAIAVPVDPRLKAGERARISDGCAVLVQEPLGGPTALTLSPRGIGDGGGGALAGGGHDLDAGAVVIHTSGTTASPRPVELTYGNLLWSALGSAVALGREPNERWLCVLPVCHVGGLSILVRSAIYATTAVVHERFDADRVLHALREQEITLVSLVATTLARLLDAGLRTPPALRGALTGGGPVPGRLLDRAHAAGVPISLSYGLTEACSQVTTTPVGSMVAADRVTGGDEHGVARRAVRASARARALTERPVSASPSAGPPLFCTRVRIAADGEILVAGPTVAPASRDADGWLHTGDLGRLGEDARLRVTGRKTETILSGGENVAPAEVEAVLEAHPHVLEAAVLGRSDPEWGQAVTAIVVVRPGVALDGETLRAHCAHMLAPHKVPKLVSVVSEPLPRTQSGKLLRREL